MYNLHTHMCNCQFRAQSLKPTCAITNFVYNLHIHMRNYKDRPSYSHAQLQRPCKSSYPHAQLPISCTIFIPTCVITKIVYNLVTQMPNYRIRIYRQTHLLNCIVRVQSSYLHVQLPLSYTIFIITCAYANLVHNSQSHVRNYQFHAQSSYPRAQLQISCTIFILTCTITNFVHNLHTYMRNYQFRVQSSYSHTQFPISCTIFIPTCILTNFVAISILQGAIISFVHNLHTHMRNYQYLVQSLYPHAQLPGGNNYVGPDIDPNPLTL